MDIRRSLFGSVALLGAVLIAGEVNAQTTVTHGRITAVRQVDIQNQGANAAGTIVGGALGVASGSGQSSSNRALRGVGGAAVGRRLAGAAGSSTGFRVHGPDRRHQHDPHRDRAERPARSVTSYRSSVGQFDDVRFCSTMPAVQLRPTRRRLRDAQAEADASWPPSSSC